MCTFVAYTADGTSAGGAVKAELAGGRTHREDGLYVHNHRAVHWYRQDNLEKKQSLRHFSWIPDTSLLDA